MKNLRSVLVVVLFACAGCKNEPSDGPKAKAEAAASTSATPVPSASNPAEMGSAAPSATAIVPAPSASAAAPPPVVPVELTMKSSDEDLEAVGKRLLGLLESSVTMLNASEGDCAKIAAGYDKVLADNPTAVAEIKMFASKRPVKKRVEAWLESHSGDLMTRVGKASAAVSKCAKNKDFKEASKRFMNVLRGR